MKLELKHIAPYLPYGVKIKLLREEYKGIYADFSIRTNSDYPISIEVSEGVIYGAMLSEVKPTLRPLSDLTKEIDVNGERFVPVKYWVTMGGNYFEYERCQNLLKKCEIGSLPYFVVKKLHEWHFDTFNLIENNLAIDINTL